VPFYVPVGPRGYIFRFGTLMTGVMGAWAYWRASRRRSPAHASLAIADVVPEFV